MDAASSPALTRDASDLSDEYLLAEEQVSVSEITNKAIAGKQVFELEHRARRADQARVEHFSERCPSWGKMAKLCNGSAWPLT